LESAFKDAREEYDLVSYIADGREQGRFLHTGPDGVPRVIVQPSDIELRFDERPVIAKIHGTVNRDMRDGDSFVITEDDYIRYLSHDDIGQLIPVDMAERLTKTHFLFLGCSLKDWNLRSVLNRLFRDAPWGLQLLGYPAKPGKILGAIMVSSRRGALCRSAGGIHRPDRRSANFSVDDSDRTVLTELLHHSRCAAALLNLDPADPIPPGPRVTTTTSHSV
jgi:hypothetical protein